MLIGLTETSAKNLHSWGLSIKWYRWPGSRSQALSLFNLLTHTHLVRLKVHQAQHPASNDSQKWCPGERHKDKVSKYSTLPAFNYLRLHLSRCISSEFRSLQGTFLPLESTVFSWIHVNFEHLQHPVVRNYTIYLCVWRNTSFHLFGTFFLLIWFGVPYFLRKVPVLLSSINWESIGFYYAFLSCPFQIEEYQLT